MTIEKEGDRCGWCGNGTLNASLICRECGMTRSGGVIRREDYPELFAAIRDQFGPEGQP